MPGIAGQDGRVEPADVDAQLERVRRHDAEHLARPQPGLDRAPLGGEVAAAVAADALARPAALAECLAQRGQQQLHRHARLAEDDRLPAGAQEAECRPVGEPERPRPDALALVDHRRIEHDDVLLAGGRAVVVDHRHGPAGESLGERLRVADRGRAEHDLRLAAVVLAQPQQPADHVGDVAAEDAAVRVRLVDDDVAQLLEELEPLGVMGQDRAVEHVRVGDNHLAG